MSPSIWQLLIVGVLVLLLFGRGRISEMMGDFGKGISSFKKGLSEEEEKSASVSPRLETKTVEPTADTTKTGDKTVS